MNNPEGPTVECQMMIRKPISSVFQAFIDPEITTNFWFTHSNSKLEAGKTVTWEWEMYGIAVDVNIVEIVPDERITITWDNPSTTVDFEFTKMSEETTYVTIKNYGFQQSGDELIKVIKDTTGGFTTVLDGLKAFLEHGIKLNLIEDKFPQNQEE